MRRRNILIRGAVIGGTTSLGLIGLFSLGKQLAGLPFLPFDIFDWMARVLPGPVVTFVIDSMVRVIGDFRLGPTASTAKLAEQSIAIVQFVLVGIFYGLVVGWLSYQRPNRGRVAANVISGILALFAVLVEAGLGFPSSGVLATILWTILLMGGWGWVFSRWIPHEYQASSIPVPRGGITRRDFLLRVVGGSIASLLVALGLDRLTASTRSVPVTSGGTTVDLLPTVVADTGGPAASPSLEVLNRRIPAAPGTRPEVTPTSEFYRVDINAEVPSVDVQSWHLQIDGLVNRPLSLSLDDLRKFPSVSQVITLECISNEVGGDLISTGEWTGTPFKTVLAQAGLKSAAAYFNITSTDGFYESLGLSEAMDERTLLVYGMNGSPLPAEHGYPLRIYIPNHYGMKQPKWIEHIEVSDQDRQGYWVERGWSKTAIVQTTSVIDNVVVGSPNQEKGTLPVGGIAYAGARGISKVEIQMDNDPWVSTQLISPPLSPLTWVEWRYDAPYQKGRHVFKVRAYDGDGKQQVAVSSPQIPNGATGIYSYTVFQP